MHICTSLGGASLSGFLPGYSEQPRIVRTVIFRSIYTAWGSGFYRFFSLFTLTPPPLAQIRPKGDFHLSTIKISSVLEARLSSPPETLGKSQFWSSRALNGLKGTFELRIARSPNVVGSFEKSLGHLLLAYVGTFSSSFIQIPWSNS